MMKWTVDGAVARGVENLLREVCSVGPICLCHPGSGLGFCEPRLFVPEPNRPFSSERQDIGLSWAINRSVVKSANALFDHVITQV